ncbi:hypothetical protein CPB85DRAFT_251833 [Mucidula mucida]|nr:hypothetical protein CPB85DRAFT_251833 [Mucidula mucida]
MRWIVIIRTMARWYKFGRRRPTVCFYCLPRLYRGSEPRIKLAFSSFRTDTSFFSSPTRVIPQSCALSPLLAVDCQTISGPGVRRNELPCSCLGQNSKTRPIRSLSSSRVYRNPRYAEPQTSNLQRLWNYNVNKLPGNTRISRTNLFALFSPRIANKLAYIGASSLRFQENQRFFARSRLLRE